MASPMIGPIIFGCIFAGTFSPLHNWVIKKTGLKRAQTSLITMMILGIFVLVPLFLIGLGLGQETIFLYQRLSEGLKTKEINDFFFVDGWGAKILHQIDQTFGLSITPELVKNKIYSLTHGISGGVVTLVNSVVGNIFSFTMDLIIMLIVIYGLFFQGPTLKRYIFDLSPLPEDQEEKILKIFNQMNHVTLVCNGLGGLIQGIPAGLALWLTGINSALLWTVIMVFLAFIPLVGISLVTIPASIYLILTSNTYAGILLFIFSASLSFFVENWFKPQFIGDRVKIDSTFVLLTIIGGMSVFGMGGIFYGPLVGILFLTMVEIYHDYYDQIT